MLLGLFGFRALWLVGDFQGFGVFGLQSFWVLGL